MSKETLDVPERRWTTRVLLVSSMLAFCAGSAFPMLGTLKAEVRATPPRPTFKDGGVISNETLVESLNVLRRLDERVARIEGALLKAVEK